MSDKTSGRDTQRIKKEAIDFATEILGQPPFMMDDTIVTGYIAGATAQLKELASLREQLAKERELRKDLVSLIDARISDHLMYEGECASVRIDELKKLRVEIESLIIISMSQHDEIPRRLRIDLMSPAEIAILNASQQIEKMPPDKRLTLAQNKLQEARNLVADFIDDHINEYSPKQ